MSETLTFGPPIISVDVEDWPQSTWDRSLPITERSVANTRRVLDILREARVRATMFVLGKLAERFPEIVREIHRDGHEIASHGYGHIEVFNQSRMEFDRDVRRSKDILESIVDAPVKGYRAPDFSITRKSLWAFDVLAAAGFRYDSSIFPIRHNRYGIPDWPGYPVRVESVCGDIVEFPIATLRIGGRNWPAGGGGYNRLLPGTVTRLFASRVMRSAPFVFYCHPYEFDPSELREIRINLPRSVRIHQGFGRRWSLPRLKVFLARFGGQSIGNLLTRTWPTVDLQTSSGSPYSG
jgi:polysaccharide deacetylase family protein (PEP-CTERM system associated)